MQRVNKNFSFDRQYHIAFPFDPEGDVGYIDLKILSGHTTRVGFTPLEI